jgi:hypothetical protein
VAHEMTIASGQALLRTPGVLDDRAGLPVLALAHGPAQHRPVAVVPGGLDQPPRACPVPALVKAPRRAG